MVEQSRVGLLVPEDEGVMVLKNIRTYSPPWHKFASHLTYSSSDRLGGAVTVIIPLLLNPNLSCFTGVWY